MTRQKLNPCRQRASTAETMCPWYNDEKKFFINQELHKYHTNRLNDP